MSFTQDEIQSFNTILDQKLAIQRRELEDIFDQRMHAFRREMDQRLASIQQEIIHSLTQTLSEQHSKFKDLLHQNLDSQQLRLPESTDSELEQRQQFEGIVERALAAQLIAMNELVNQRFSSLNHVPYIAEAQAGFDGIEVQTEIPWDDLADMVSKALDERLSMLDESIHSSLNDVFVSIEQLERLIESMQVAMTANHALLSNRVYHHQQLPLERAHSSNQTASTPNSSPVKDQLPLPQENEQQE